MRTAGLVKISAVIKPRHIKYFEDKILRNEHTDCWIWNGIINHGYGEFRIRTLHRTKVYMRAHRLAWEIYRGPIPARMVVCHKCDVKHCVNPQHLFLGSQADNMRDMKNKRRSTKGRILKKRKLK